MAGFRRLFSIGVKLKPLNVLIGPNGAGKTSLLDALSLLSASAAGELNSALSELGGLGSLLTSGRANRLVAGLTRADGHAPVEYQLEIAPLAAGYEISREWLCQKTDPGASQPLKYIDSVGQDVRYYQNRKLARPNWEHNPLETSLSQVPKMFANPEEFRRGLASLTHYTPLRIYAGAPVRTPQTMQPATLPGVNGESLVSCLYFMRETDPDRFDLVNDTLAAGFNTFQGLSFPPVAAGTLAMTWKDREISTPLYMHQLSDGTLRFLWLVTLLLSQGLTSVTLIDEPELSLHPVLLRVLADLLREASLRTQLVIATHSERLIRFLTPDEVLVCDLEEDGTARITRASDIHLDRWLADYSLDEIWAMNVLGGRP